MERRGDEDQRGALPAGAALQPALSAASALLDPAALAALTVAHARDLVGLDGAGLYWWDAAAAVLRSLASNDPRVPEPLPVLRPGQGVAGQAFARGAPVVATDYADWSHAAVFWARRGLASAVAVPLLVGTQARGALVAWSYTPCPVTPEQVRLLGVIGAQVTPALETMRLLAEAERRRAEAEALAALMRHGAADLDTARVCALVTEHAGRLLGADYAVVALAEADGATTYHGAWGTRAQAWHTTRLARGEGAAGQTLAAGRTVVMERLGENPAYPLDELPVARAEGARTVLHTPLRSREQAVGALLLGWRSDVRPTAAQIGLAETLASYAAALLASARAHTALVASERRLQESVQRTTTILESIAEAFVALDHERRFTYVNAAAERVLRRPAAALLGRRLRAVFPEGVGSPIHVALRAAMAEGTPRIFEAEYPPLGVWFEIHAYPSPDGLALYFQDITARKRAEAERAALLAEAQVARAAAEAATRVRDDFLTAAAHHLRTPLTSLVGYADLLQRKLDAAVPPRPEALRPSVSALRQAAGRLATVVEAMTDVAHLQMGWALPLRPTEVDLGPLAREVARQTALEVGPTAAVAVRGAQEGLVVRADRARLARALHGLLANALTHGAGAEPAGVAVRRAGAWVVLRVRDHGPGIAPARLSALVTDVVRPSLARGIPGTHVGLAGAKGIIEQHGGVLRVAAAPGGGTAVLVALLGDPGASRGGTRAGSSARTGTPAEPQPAEARALSHQSGASRRGEPPPIPTATRSSLGC